MTWVTSNVAFSISSPALAEAGGSLTSFAMTATSIVASSSLKVCEVALQKGQARADRAVPGQNDSSDRKTNTRTGILRCIFAPPAISFCALRPIWNDLQAVLAQSLANPILGDVCRRCY